MRDKDMIRRGDALDCFIGLDCIVDIMDAIAALPAVTPATSSGVTAGAVGEWLPCPLCGDAIETEGEGVEHRASDTCPLDSMFMLPEHREAWNRRATPPTALDDPRVRKLVEALQRIGRCTFVDAFNREGPSYEATIANAALRDMGGV